MANLSSCVTRFQIADSQLICTFRPPETELRIRIQGRDLRAFRPPGKSIEWTSDTKLQAAGDRSHRRCVPPSRTLKRTSEVVRVLRKLHVVSFRLPAAHSQAIATAYRMFLDGEPSWPFSIFEFRLPWTCSPHKSVKL